MALLTYNQNEFLPNFSEEYVNILFCVLSYDKYETAKER